MIDTVKILNAEFVETLGRGCIGHDDDAMRNAAGRDLVCHESFGGGGVIDIKRSRRHARTKIGLGSAGALIDTQHSRTE